MIKKLEENYFFEIIEGVCREVWLLLGVIFILIGLNIWYNDIDLGILGFSVRNLSVGVVLFGLLTSIVGSIKLFSQILDIQTDEKILAQEIKKLVNEQSDLSFSEIMYKKVREQSWLFLGGILMILGFGAWEMVILGLSFRIISISMISIGFVITSLGGFQLLFDFLFGKITKTQVNKANDIILYGLICSSSKGDVSEFIITEPAKLPFNDEIKTSIVKKSISACGVPQSEEGSFNTYTFSVIEEQCTVVAFCFLYENKQVKSVSSHFILNFVIRPPLSNREDLLQRIWGDRKKFSKLFDHMYRVRDSIKDSLDKETIHKELETLKNILTKYLILVFYEDSRQIGHSNGYS